jgi:uncharacterized protein
MKAKLINNLSPKTYALVFDAGDEPMSGLSEFAKQNHLGASHFTGIGGFQDVVLGYFELEKKDYKRIPVDQQVEVLSLVGDIALEKDEPKIHAHVVVGTSNGAAYGGHLLRARVRPTLELIVTESPQHLRRQFNEALGLALIHL